MPALTKDLLNSLPSFETLALSSSFAAIFLFAVNKRAGTLTINAGKIFTAASLGFVGLFRSVTSDDFLSAVEKMLTVAKEIA